MDLNTPKQSSEPSLRPDSRLLLKPTRKTFLSNVSLHIQTSSIKNKLQEALAGQDPCSPGRGTLNSPVESPTARRAQYSVMPNNIPTVISDQEYIDRKSTMQVFLRAPDLTMALGLKPGTKKAILINRNTSLDHVNNLHSKMKSDMVVKLGKGNGIMYTNELWSNGYYNRIIRVTDLKKKREGIDKLAYRTKAQKLRDMTNLFTKKERSSKITKMYKEVHQEYVAKFQQETNTVHQLQLIKPSKQNSPSNASSGMFFTRQNSVTKNEAHSKNESVSTMDIGKSEMGSTGYSSGQKPRSATQAEIFPSFNIKPSAKNRFIDVHNDPKQYDTRRVSTASTRMGPDTNRFNSTISTRLGSPINNDGLLHTHNTHNTYNTHNTHTTHATHATHATQHTLHTQHNTHASTKEKSDESSTDFLGSHRWSDRRPGLQTITSKDSNEPQKLSRNKMDREQQPLSVPRDIFGHLLIDTEEDLTQNAKGRTLYKDDYTDSLSNHELNRPLTREVLHFKSNIKSLIFGCIDLVSENEHLKKDFNDRIDARENNKKQKHKERKKEALSDSIHQYFHRRRKTTGDKNNDAEVGKQLDKNSPPVI